MWVAGRLLAGPWPGPLAGRRAQPSGLSIIERIHARGVFPEMPSDYRVWPWFIAFLSAIAATSSSASSGAPTRAAQPRRRKAAKFGCKPKHSDHQQVEALKRRAR